MCNCLKEIEQNILGQKTKFKDRLIDAIEIESVLSKIDGTFIKIPYIAMKINVEGIKKTYKTAAVFNYCPFCGQKYVKGIIDN